MRRIPSSLTVAHSNLSGVMVAPMHEFGTYPVTEISHYIIRLADKTALAARFWLPWKIQHDPGFLTKESKKFSELINSGTKAEILNPEQTFPAILEMLPYGKDMLTIARDHQRHSWFCSHGYVVARVDMRGTGESEGLYFDEYTKEEQADTLQVIEWLGKQQWCSGNVGMYGKSWGGFNGLQAAFNQPENLKAVISLYSTDDRYTDDVHYLEGDCLFAAGMLSWGSTMLGLNAKPPHPRYFSSIDAWKQTYLHRLNNSACSWTKTWLSHQSHDDPYWINGSINADYARIKCPVLIIGGIADGYTNAAFRMAAKLNETSKAIIGPWAHVWPDNGKPGPNINYLKVCLQWWNCHLKRTGPPTDQWPQLQLYVQESTPPSSYHKTVPGFWIQVPKWRQMYDDFEHPKLTDVALSTKILYLSSTKKLSKQEKDDGVEILLQAHPLQGAGTGEDFCWGEHSLPGDQALANQHSQCWNTEVLGEPIAIIGFNRLRLKVKLSDEQHNAIICVRLCDEQTNGKSTRIAMGAKKIAVSKTHEICLSASAYIVPAGHKLTLAISLACFPKIFPPSQIHAVSVIPGDSCLVYQTLSSAELAERISFDQPGTLLQLPSTEIEPSNFTNTGFKKDEQGNWKTSATETSGKVHYHGIDTIWSTSETDTAMISDNCEKCALKSVRQIEAEFKSYGIKLSIKTHSTMSEAMGTFVLNDELNVKLNDEEFFKKSWNNDIPRDYV